MADYTLAPPPYQTLLDNAGAPVSNGCVWTYSAGTTTPIATYSDAFGTPNTNPIRTDPAGRFTAYLTPGVGYKFVYEGPATPPAHGVVLRTADHIIGPPAAQAVQIGTWVPSLGADATYSAREATYVRQGPLVFARGSLTVAAIGSANPGLISGLPFEVAGSAVGTITYSNAASALVGGAVYAADLDLYTMAQAGASPTLAATPLLTDGTSITFSVTYLTAAP